MPVKLTQSGRRRKKAERSEGSARFERFFPVSILLLVALTQVILASQTTLSPWKGGGFGMFAVVDAPGMRILDGFGTLPDGQEVRLDVFGSLKPGLTLRRQSLPNPEELAPMAHGLLTRQWVPVTLQDRAALARIRSDNPGIDLPAELLLRQDAPLYRVLTRDDPAAGDLPPVNFRAIRLRWWKLVWDPQTHQLTTTPIGPEIRAQLPRDLPIAPTPAP